jgi:hypothetical protein
MISLLRALDSYLVSSLTGETLFVGDKVLYDSSREYIITSISSTHFWLKDTVSNKRRFLISEANLRCKKI